MSAADAALEALVGVLADKLAQRLHEAARGATSGEVGETAGSPWMNVATAAAYLYWPRQRLYKLTAQGAIPHYKHDGRLLFNRQELDQWLAGFRSGGDWRNVADRAISR